MPHPHGQDDELTGKGYDSALMWKFFVYIRPYMRYLLLTVLVIVVSTALNLAGPLVIKDAIEAIIDPALSQAVKKDKLLYYIFIYFGLQGLRGVLVYIQAQLTNYIGQNVILDIRRQVFRHMQALSMSFFDKNPIGRLVTRVSSDIENLLELFSSGLIMFFTDVLLLVGICVMMFVINWQLALVSLSVLPAVLWATIFFRTKARQAYRDTRKKIAVINSFLQENISGHAVVQLFGMRRSHTDKFKEQNQDLLLTHLKTLLYFALFFPSLNLFFTISTAFLLWYGGTLIIGGAIAFPVFFLFWTYTQKFFHPLRDLSEQFNVIQSAMASSERIFKLLDTRPDVVDSPSSSKLSEFRGEIEFQHVWFAYEGDNYILKDVSFRVRHGESVAIVGLTGSGKTTIINLICRFYDIQKGRILIDGRDIKDIEIASLRSKVGLILQDVFLFTGTIEENVTLGNKDITPEKVMSSIEYVNAGDFVRRLPDGLKSEVKERGATFSVGEKQLLSFARALAYDPKLLILDEATSSVDTESEILIQAALEKLIKGRTSIVIAHRLSTIKDVDRIIVMHKGHIAEEGPHQELLKKNGIYTKLYELQYRLQNAEA